MRSSYNIYIGKLDVVSNNAEYQNISITNCSFSTLNSSLILNGKNITVSNNIFNRKTKGKTILDFIKCNYLRGTNNISDNHFNDYNGSFNNIVVFNDASTDGDYSRSGTLNINNNYVTNMRGSILRQENSNYYNSLTMNININNNMITSRYDITPVYFLLASTSDMSYINLLTMSSNVFTNNNSYNRLYNGLIYIARNIFIENNDIYMTYPAGKFSIENNATTKLTIKTTNFYGYNGINSTIGGVLKTLNYNVNNENIIVISETPSPTYYFNTIYSYYTPEVYSIIKKYIPSTYDKEVVMDIKNTDSSLTFNVVFDDIIFSDQTGYTYAIYHEQPYVVSAFSITITNSLDQIVSDFSSDPITIEFDLPQVDPTKVVKVYKVDSVTKIKLSTQPTNYPITLTYNSNTNKYSGTFYSFSDFIIEISETPAPSGTPALVTFFINDSTIVNQDTVIVAYERSTDDRIYDYIIDINMASMNDMFVNRVYYQNQSFPNEYESNLYINTDMLSNKLDSVTISSNKATVYQSMYYGSLYKSSETVGEKFVEIMATKIFGNATANAAIINDSEFIEEKSQLVNNIRNAFVNQSNSLFAQYVVLDRFVGYPTDQYFEYNLDEVTIELPVYLKGVVKVNTDLVDASDLSFTKALKYGTYAGGTTINNGSYNVPILFRFHE